MSHKKAFALLRKELGMKPRTKEEDVLAMVIALVRTVKASEKASGGNVNWFLDTGGSIPEDEGGDRMELI